ncbi:MAG: hypothetical protein AB8F78_09360 [Saprospiraceae bacterium]
MKRILLLLTVLGALNLGAQHAYDSSILTDGSKSISLLSGFPNILESDLIFYGFIHGAETPQHVEAQLLIELLKKGVKYYAPEVSPSGAYFLNKFLATGNEDYLHYVLQTYAAPQDASKQWIEKYNKVYTFNNTLPDSDRLSIIGTDREDSDKLKISHLAHLLPDEETGISIIDSLKLYLAPEETLHFTNGKHLFKLAFKHGCSYKDILYDQKSQHYFAKRFTAYYDEHTEKVLGYFKHNREEVMGLMTSSKTDRETTITDRFTQKIIPLLEEGQKVYSNYGYAHVLQESFNGKTYLAGRLKRAYPNLSIYSILSQLADCSVLESAKVCEDRKIKRYGKTITLAKVCGVSNSTEWDGDTTKERIRGLDEIQQVTPASGISLIPVANLSQEQSASRYFIDYEDGKNTDDIKLDLTKTTSDYFQGLIFIQGSKANTPYDLPSE